MTLDSMAVDILNASDAALLTKLLEDCAASQSLADVKPFRRDHYLQIATVDRLEKLGYLIKERNGEREFYRVSFMAIVQMRESQSALTIMETAESMWTAFRQHYERSLDQPVTLKAIADSLGLSIEHVTLVHTYMREWWHTPSCFSLEGSPDQSVTVREDVLAYPTFADCVQQLRELQARRLQAPHHGFVGLGVQETSPTIPAASVVGVARRPSWMEKLPPHAQLLMREIYTAMDAGLLTLPAMGIRAVIDVVSDDILGVSLGGFYEKLEALRLGGHLTPKQFDVLKAVIEVGHAAAHRAHSPDRAATQLMIDSLEHMLFSAYELDGASSALSAKTPSRPKRIKAAK